MSEMDKVKMNEEAKISEEAKINDESQKTNKSQKSDKLNGFCLVGGVLGILTWLTVLQDISALLAVIFSCLGICQIKESNEKGVGLGVLGLLSAIIYILIVFSISYQTTTHITF